jgi:DNA-binding transcriptional MerR regulator
MKNFGLKKLYYSISEVSKLTGVEQYILRYWETEFNQLRPSKNRAGNRIYTNKDINLILQIKKLLREEKYTIEGAKKILDDKISYQEPVHETEEEPKQKIISPISDPNHVLLMELKHFLVNLSRQI